MYLISKNFNKGDKVIAKFRGKVRLGIAPDDSSKLTKDCGYAIFIKGSCVGFTESRFYKVLGLLKPLNTHA